MKHYLFVHFREKTSPEGEQVYFSVSRGGFQRVFTSEPGQVGSGLGGCKNVKASEIHIEKMQYFN